MKNLMKITHYAFVVSHPNHKPIAVNFQKNEGVDSGYNVFVEMKGEKKAYEFFFNSELQPCADDAKDYAFMYLKIMRKI